MGIIGKLRAKFLQNKFEFSKHAVDQTMLRDISIWEIQEAISNSELVEDYPNDKYGPSCLLFGTATHNRPLHIQCSYPSRPIVKVITVYEPDPERWVQYRTRRQ